MPAARKRWIHFPTGVHSGLAKSGAKGVFFYFQARPSSGSKQHFWKYYDLKDHRIVDNRYVVANLIACQKDTPRIVDPELFRGVFELQEIVIEDILASEEEKRALEVAPRAVDPIQQTVATVIQSYLNHPEIERKQAIEVIRFLNQPMLRVQVQALRKDFRAFQQTKDIRLLISNIEKLKISAGRDELISDTPARGQRLTREDLRLICFDFLNSA